MLQQRVQYWSCTKFANNVRKWLGAQEKPFFATTKEWNEWYQNAKRYKFAIWLTDDVFDGVQNFIYWPLDALNVVRYYVKARFFDKMHYLPTRLEKGKYYDLDTRLMHGLFESLVDFVEKEKTHMQLISYDEDRRGVFRYHWSLLRWSSFRSRELGLKYLDWEMTLDSPDMEDDQMCETQAQAAREIVALYTWWKDIRPARPDPYDASGWSDYCKSRSDRGCSMFAEKTEEEHQQSDVVWKRLEEIETQQLQEDDAMLIRLIKIRRSLWT
jgi:hypothetical protein